MINLALGRQTVGDIDELIAESLRLDAPVRLSRRQDRETLEPLVLDLAASGLPFGAGPRRCPGEAVALELAAGFVEGVVDRCSPVQQDVVYEPSPNLRLPARLLVQVG